MRHRPLALVVSATLLAFATPSIAGDLLDTTPEPQWVGFYAGGQLGGAWSDTGWGYNNRNWFNTLGSTLLINHFDMDASGVLGGGQLGYNFQSGALVFGVEASTSVADLDARRRDPNFPASDTFSSDYDWLTTATGRVGISSGAWLAYAKGGWAGADVELDLFDRDTPVRAKSSTWANGYTLGGGAEYAFGNGLSLGVEYAYVDLDVGNFTLRCPDCLPGVVGGGVPNLDGDIEIQSVTARLNYHFGR